MLRAATETPVLSRLEMHIRDAFSLYHRTTSDKAARRFRDQEIAALTRIPGLCDVFMFHGDGHVRKAAINRLEGPLISAASVYALRLRLNDWAPEVRKAAARAKDRCLPQTSAPLIVPVLKALLPDIASWRLRSQDEPQAIVALLMCQDIAELMLKDIIETRQARLGHNFRKLFRNPGIDPHIENVFHNAVLPHIRSMALDALVLQKMRWPTGQYRKVWINRYARQHRLVPVFQERDLTVDVDIESCLTRSAQDRASTVRRRAADAMIALRHDDDLQDRIDEIAKTLTNDKNRGVRDRIAFLHRKRLEET